MGKIKLGMTYSKQIEPIFDEISKYIDVIECSSNTLLENPNKEWTLHLRRNRPNKPESKEFNLFNPYEVENTLRYYKEYVSKNPKILSFHFGYPVPELEHYPGKRDKHYISSYKAVSLEEAWSKWQESLKKIYNEFKSIPLAIENMDYHDTEPYKYITEPSTLEKLFDENKEYYFLLDIPHAEVSAINHSKAKPEDKLDPKKRFKITKDYIDQLPLEKVKEIHITGPTIEKNGKAVDTHVAITDVEMKLLEPLLDVPNLYMVNLESRIVTPTELDNALTDLKKLREIL